MKNHYMNYFILVFVGSIPFYALNFLYTSPVFLNLPLSFLMIIVPCLVAGYMMYQDAGKQGLNTWLLSSLDIRKVKHAVYLLLAFLTIPLIFTVASYLHDPSFRFFQIFEKPLLPSLLTFLAFYLGAILEELGWTSYLTPLIQKRLGIFRTGLMIGLFWGAWHILPYISQGKGFIDVIALVNCAIAYRIIMGYIYDYSGKAVITGIIFHTMINFYPEILPHGYDSFSFITVAILTWIIAGVCFVWEGSKWTSSK